METRQEKLTHIADHLRIIAESCRQIRLTPGMGLREIFGIEQLDATFGASYGLEAMHDLADGLGWQLAGMAEKSGLVFRRHEASRAPVNPVPVTECLALQIDAMFNARHGPRPVIEVDRDETPDVTVALERFDVPYVSERNDDAALARIEDDDAA